MKHSLLILLLLTSACLNAQDKLFTERDLNINQFIEGTLLAPQNNSKSTLAILIGDSGPTDRNGNQNFAKNNILKKLAEALTNKGIATYRYDKRIVKQIRKGRVDKNMLFDDFITDAISVINYFKLKNSYSKIYIIGHGQGSLVGMVAAKNKADGFISLAGSGKSIDETILEQIEKTAPMFAEDSKKTFDLIKQGQTSYDYPQALASVFDISLQPFMSSWMKYHPLAEIKKLEIPVLIINGTKDLQISPEEAATLKDESSRASLKIVNNMNHILFLIEGDNLENSKSYNESFRNISTEVIESIMSFIK